MAPLQEKLEEITNGYYKPFEENAVKFNKRVERKAGIDFVDPHPEFFLKTSDLGHNIYTVKFLIPTHEANKIASQITRDFLSYVHKEKSKQTDQE